MTEKYYTLKENAVWNIPADLITGTRITVDLDGKTVEAYVRVDVKNLMVMVSDLKWGHESVTFWYALTNACEQTGCTFDIAGGTVWIDPK